MPALAAPHEDGARAAPRSRKGVQTRARLVDAAKQIFEERGFLEARISDIAERAGLSHGAFYNYFDSKEEVFREVATAVDDRLSEPLSSVILARGSAVGTRDRFLIAIHRHLEAYQREARIMRVVEEFARYDEQVSALRAAASARHRQRMGDSIRLMQRRRLADPKLDPDIAAAALGSMVERFAEMWLAQRQLDADLDDVAVTLATVLGNALGLSN